MFGFHRRTRSLIPVKDLAKYDQVPLEEEEKQYEEELQEQEQELEVVAQMPLKDRRLQLTLVYVIFVAEA